MKTWTKRRHLSDSSKSSASSCGRRSDEPGKEKENSETQCKDYAGVLERLPQQALQRHQPPQFSSNSARKIDVATKQCSVVLERLPNILPSVPKETVPPAVSDVQVSTEGDVIAQPCPTPDNAQPGVLLGGIGVDDIADMSQFLLTKSSLTVRVRNPQPDVPAPPALPPPTRVNRLVVPPANHNFKKNFLTASCKRPRGSRSTFKYFAFRYPGEIPEEGVEPMDVGRLDEKTCPHCGAFFFFLEGTKRDGLYRTCCHRGKITVQPFVKPTGDVGSFFTGDFTLAEEFRKNIRLYNNLMSFGMTKAKYTTGSGRGPYFLSLIHI